MTYRAILVDLFGTIIPKPDRSRHNEFMANISTILDVEVSRIEEFWRASYPGRLKGAGGSSLGSVRYFLDMMGSEYDEEAASSIDKEWYEITKELLRFFDDVAPALKKMRGAGMKVGLVTNCGANVPPLFESHPISELFDTMVYSSSEGITKPEPEIYIRGCRNLGFQPGECVFVGDGDNDELIGSSEAGLRTIKIDRGSSAGDYMIKEPDEWDPTISSFSELHDMIL